MTALETWPVLNSSVNFSIYPPLFFTKVALGCWTGMSLTGTLKSCQHTSIHWWERLQLAPIKSFHFLQSRALEFSNIKQPIQVHLKGGEKGKGGGEVGCFWATRIQLWLVRIHFSCDHLQPSDPNCFPSFWLRQDLYAYPRLKGQHRMYCANTLINAARFLKRGSSAEEEAYWQVQWH